MPIWIWKSIVALGAIVGTFVWCRHPHYRYVIIKNKAKFYVSEEMQIETRLVNVNFIAGSRVIHMFIIKRC